MTGTGAAGFVFEGVAAAGRTAAAFAATVITGRNAAGSATPATAGISGKYGIAPAGFVGVTWISIFTSDFHIWKKV
jgi:hypothetical protein